MDFSLTFYIIATLVFSLAITVILYFAQKNKLVKANLRCDELNKKYDSVNSQLIQSSKMSTLGTIAAGLVHELNNPLTSVVGFANHLLKVEKGLSENGQDYLNRVVASANRMKKIVDHVRIYVRESRNVERRPVDMREVFSNSLILIERQLLATNIELKQNFVDTVSSNSDNNHIIFPVNANKVQIESVIQNILINSVHAFESVARNESKCIEMTMTKDGDSIEIIVEDNASGMSQETIENIFNPFFTTKIEGSGTGLGMSVSKTIIDEHEGSIFIESEEGKYTRATINLPIGDETALLELMENEEDIEEAINSVKNAMNRVEPQVTKVSKEIYWPRVLVIDDELDILDLLEMMIGDTFDLVLESSSKRGIELIKSETFDLIVTDVSMPEFNGLDVTKIATEYAPETPVIIISGHARKNSGLNELIDAGAVELIPKPFLDEEEIRETLMRHYKKKTQQIAS
jgi:signal transduction histidine kinase/ActR/RegA family two-component response regulator